MTDSSTPSKDVALSLRELADKLPKQPVHLGLLQQALRGGAADIEQLRERVKDLQQFHDWAEPQVHDHGRDVLEIERLRVALRAALHPHSRECAYSKEWKRGVAPQCDCGIGALLLGEPSRDETNGVTDEQAFTAAAVRALRGHRWCGDQYPENGWPDINTALALYAKLGRSPLEPSPEPCKHGHTNQGCRECFPLKASGELCEGCPPVGYPTDETRCTPCPRRSEKVPRPRVPQNEHEATLTAIRTRDTESVPTWFKEPPLGACGRAFIDRRWLLKELDTLRGDMAQDQQRIFHLESALAKPTP